MPETALELAERASQMGTGWYYTSTLGQAYVANDRYEDAFKEFKRSVNSMSQSYARHTDTTRELWSRVAAAGKNAKDERSYVEMVEKLANATAVIPLPNYTPTSRWQNSIVNGILKSESTSSQNGFHR